MTLDDAGETEVLRRAPVG